MSRISRGLSPLRSHMWPLQMLGRSASSSPGAPSDGPVRSPTGVRAVVFDLGGVLISAPKYVWRDRERQLGLPRGAILEFYVNQRHPRVPTGVVHHAWEIGELGGEDLERIFAQGFWQEAFSTVIPFQYDEPWNAGYGRPIDLFRCYDKNHHTLKPMLQVVENVAAYGLQTLLLTNNGFLDNNRSRTWLEVDTSNFGHIVESCRVGARKPDAKIFETAQEELECPPRDVLFIDDLGVNLKGARNSVGWRTLKFSEMEIAKSIREIEEETGLPLSIPVPAGTRNPRPSMLLDLRALRSYLSERFPEIKPDSPLMVREFEHGQSNPTYYVRFGKTELVLRKKPPGKLLPSAHQVEREFQVMNAVKEQGVPVARLHHLCEDPNVLGTPFYVMDFVRGRVFKDPALPGLEPSQRKAIYTAVIDTLAAIHKVDIDKDDRLKGFGKREKYLQRNLSRWVKQYEASKTRDIPAMNRLMEWLPRNMPSEERCTLVHGDYRLDNLIFDESSIKVLAVLDWELSTLGDPYTDLAICALAHHLPSTSPMLQGLSDRLEELPGLGIPLVSGMLEQYFAASGQQPIPVNDWCFYVAFVFFRMASILQGVYKRYTLGQSTSPLAPHAGEVAERLAEMACAIAASSPSSKSAPELSEAGGMFPVTPDSLAPKARKVYDDVLQFINEEILPREKQFLDHMYDPQRSKLTLPLYEELKKKAKSRGLFNLFIPKSLSEKDGAMLTNVEYAHVCELMGRSLFAPLAFNCSAPDTGNMEVLLHYGNEEQKEEWLKPLLEGKIRSCFAMTEPKVASSDATNIESSIVRDGNEYVVNGHKWFISGACDPDCRICIFMGKTDPAAPRHRQQSMILVPMDTPGLTVKRPMTSLGFTDLPGGHAEMLFDNVRVPVSNLILGEGDGFKIAQGRLGPGRIHHCMRLIGHSERALDMMKERVNSRVAFGKPLAQQGTIRADIAKSRIEIEQARLLVLKTAHMMDTVGNKAAAPEIAMIKVIVPSMAMRVIDRSIQAHGAMGVSQDTPLAMMYAWARNIRIADGPDEVHMEALARKELKSRL